MAMFGLVPVKNGQKVGIYWTCQNVRLPPPYPALLPRPPPSASFFSFCPGGFNVTQCKYYVFLSLAIFGPDRWRIHGKLYVSGEC